MQIMFTRSSTALPGLSTGPLHEEFYCSRGIELTLADGATNAACQDVVLEYDWLVVDSPTDLQLTNQPYLVVAPSSLTPGVAHVLLFRVLVSTQHSDFRLALPQPFA